MPSSEDALYARLERRLQRQMSRLNNTRAEGRALGFEGDSDEDQGPEQVRERWVRHSASLWAPAMRVGCAAVALGRRLFLFGGLGSCGATDSAGRFNSVAVYDTETYRWAPVQCEGTPPPPCSGHTVTLIDDNTAYLFGGEGAFAHNGGRSARTSFNHLFSFDFRTSHWKRLPLIGCKPFMVVPQPRRGHTSTLLHSPQGSRLLVFGGTGPDRVFMQDNYFNDVQVLDLESLTWKEATASGAVPTPRAGHTATLAPGSNLLYVFGGVSADIVSTRSQPRIRSRMSGVGDTSEPCVGAEEDVPFAPFAAPDVHVLDVVSMRWERLSVSGTPPPPRHGHTATFSPKMPECLYVAGGRTALANLAGTVAHADPISPSVDNGIGGGIEVHLLDTKLRTWSRVETVGDVPPARFGHVCSAMRSSQLVIFGGSSFMKYCPADTFALHLVWRPASTRASTRQGEAGGRESVGSDEAEIDRRSSLSPTSPTSMLSHNRTSSPQSREGGCTPSPIGSLTKHSGASGTSGGGEMASGEVRVSTPSPTRAVDPDSAFELLRRPRRSPYSFMTPSSASAAKSGGRGGSAGGSAPTVQYVHPTSAAPGIGSDKRGGPAASRACGATLKPSSHHRTIGGGGGVRPNTADGRFSGSVASSLSLRGGAGNGNRNSRSRSRYQGASIASQQMASGRWRPHTAGGIVRSGSRGVRARPLSSSSLPSTGMQHVPSASSSAAFGGSAQRLLSAGGARSEGLLSPSTTTDHSAEPSGGVGGTVQSFASTRPMEASVASFGYEGGVRFSSFARASSVRADSTTLGESSAWSRRITSKSATPQQRSERAMRKSLQSVTAEHLRRETAAVAAAIHNRVSTSKVLPPRSAHSQNEGSMVDAQLGRESSSGRFHSPSVLGALNCSLGFSPLPSRGRNDSSGRFGLYSSGRRYGDSQFDETGSSLEELSGAVIMGRPRTAPGGAGEGGSSSRRSPGSMLDGRASPQSIASQRSLSPPHMPSHVQTEPSARQAAQMSAFRSGSGAFSQRRVAPSLLRPQTAAARVYRGTQQRACNTSAFRTSSSSMASTPTTVTRSSQNMRHQPKCRSSAESCASDRVRTRKPIPQIGLATGGKGKGHARPKTSHGLPRPDARRCGAGFVSARPLSAQISPAKYA